MPTSGSEKPVAGVWIHDEWEGSRENQIVAHPHDTDQLPATSGGKIGCTTAAACHRSTSDEWSQTTNKYPRNPQPQKKERQGVTPAFLLVSGFIFMRLDEKNSMDR
jgi:hypothetical protein